MFLADHLSRAAQKKIVMPEDSFQVFSVDLENNIPIPALKIFLQHCSGQDESLQTLKTTILSGCPDQRDKAHVNIREYCNDQDELSVHSGVLFKGMESLYLKLCQGYMQATKAWKLVFEKHEAQSFGQT